MNLVTRLSTALGTLLLMTGCATVQMADQQAQDDIKQFRTQPGLTNLFVCREQAFLVGAGITTDVQLDGESIGFVKPNTFVQAWVEPGEHTIQMKNDGIAGMHSPKITFETQGSDTRFLWIGVTGGGMGTYTIDHFETPQAGMRCVQDAKYSVAR
jgi:hypothetical protein